MSEEKDTKETKKKVKYDEDVVEMADVYEQLYKLLKEASIETTSDALEAMAVSICIGRGERKMREESRNRTNSAPASTPTNTNATSKTENSEERVCPTCGAVLMKKYAKSGRGYFSCGKCKQFVNDDGSVKAWQPKN